MKTISTTIGGSGEVRLPPDVLRLLGVGPNDRVELVIEDTAVRIIPAGRTTQPGPLAAQRVERAARRRAALAQISAAFAHESVEEAERSVAAALAEVRAEDQAAQT